VNSLVDEKIIDALYKASMAGVPVDIFVRGMCSLRPGVPGLSDTIKVRSVLGRYREHSRAFAFANGGDPRFYIGSADMMHRNLDRRVEALVSLVQPDHMKEIQDLFELAMSDAAASWHLDSTGTWTRRQLDQAGKPLIDVQDELMRRVAAKRSRS
jgi:polyphosphate kinase